MTSKTLFSFLLCSLVSTSILVGMEKMSNTFQQLTLTAAQSGALEYAKRKIQEDPHIFYNACKNGDFEQVKLLAVAPEIINSKNEDGYTPLYVAADYGHLAVVKVLIERGAVIDAQNNDGCTPLHVACQNGHTEVVHCLVEQGVDVNIQSNKKWTPLDVESANYLAVLEKVGAIIRTVTLADGTQRKERLTDGGVSPLHLACKNNHKDIVDILIKHDAQIGACTGSGYTPIHVACQYGHAELVKFLILKGFLPISKASINRKASLQEQCLIKILHDGKSINDAVAHGIARIFSLNLEHNNLTKIIAEHAPLKLQQRMIDYWKKNAYKENVDKQRYLLEIHCNRYFAYLKSILTKKELPVSKTEFAQQIMSQFRRVLTTFSIDPSTMPLDLQIDQAYMNDVQSLPLTRPVIVELAQQLNNNDVLDLVTNIVYTATFDALKQDVKQAIIDNITDRLTLQQPSSCNTSSSWSNRND